MALVSWTGRRTRVFAGVTSTQRVMVALWEVSVKGKLHVTPLVIVWMTVCAKEILTWTVLFSVNVVRDFLDLIARR